VQIPPLPGGRRCHAPGHDGAAILLLEPLAVDLEEELLNRRPIVGQDALRLALQVGLEEQRPASVVPLRTRRVQRDLNVPARLTPGPFGLARISRPATRVFFLISAIASASLREKSPVITAFPPSSLRMTGAVTTLSSIMIARRLPIDSPVRARKISAPPLVSMIVTCEVAPTGPFETPAQRT